jgi:hypothetical protein
MGEDLFIPPAPVAACAPSAAVCACPRSSTRPFRPTPRHVSSPQWLRAIHLSSAHEYYVHAYSPVRARSLRPVPRIRASSPRRSHLSVPEVRARSHPPAPLTTRSRPTRSRSYQRAHALDNTGDQCTPTIISRWSPLQPRAPPPVYKPVGAPS